MTGPKVWCPSSGADAPTEQRRNAGTVLVQCPDCKRILKPTPKGKLHKHQERNRTTESMDNTRDILWAHGVPVTQGKHFAIGLRVYVRHGAKPYGWGDEPFDDWYDDDYDRAWSISDVSEGEGKERDSFMVNGWSFLPEDLVQA